MKKVLLIILTASIVAPVMAQRGKNDARAYFKDFQSETRRISRKNYIYLEASVKGTDPARVQRYREMVVEQLNDSKNALDRITIYEGDDVLKREYMDALDMYLKAFGEQFKVADSLNTFKFNSFKDLMLYNKKLTEAEQNMIDASYKIKKAEEYFAKKYDVELRRDEETEEEYRMLDEITLYARDMTEAFFRVDDQSQRFINVAARNHTDSLEQIVDAMRDAINTSQNTVDTYGDDLENDKLKRDVKFYLEDVKEDLSVQLMPLAEKLDNPYMEEKEYKKAKKELENFIYQTKKYREDFFDARADLIEDYLPSK